MRSIVVKKQVADYEQKLQQRLTNLRLSGQLSEAEYRLVNQHVRLIAMLDVPLPKSALVCWVFSKLNLFGLWIRWKHYERVTTARQQLEPKLYHQVAEIINSCQVF